MRRFRLECPAKVNLFLSVGPRDVRGYHPLRTIFQTISLCDTLEVEFGGEGFRLDIVGADLPSENTLTKALRLSREVFPMHPSLIRLEKRIPMQSGLGGGSSDAAGVLRALSVIAKAPDAESEAIASAVGADVPFFLVGGRARAEGYGERLTPLADGPEEWFLVVKPSLGCSTPQMFAKLDASPRTWRDWPESDVLFNDFEAVAPEVCLTLKMRLLEAGAKDAALSGSGSSVFGRFGSKEAANEAADRFPEESVCVAHSISRAESLRIEESTR